MTTFDKFFAENPEQKEIYDKKYNDFLPSEFMLEQMEKQNLSIRELAKKSRCFTYGDSKTPFEGFSES